MPSPKRNGKREKKRIADDNPVPAFGGYSRFLEVLAETDRTDQTKVRITQMSQSLIRKGETSARLALEQGYVCESFSLYDLFCSRIVFESSNAILLQVFELIKIRGSSTATTLAEKKSAMVVAVTTILMRAVVVLGKVILSGRFQNNPTCLRALDGILSKMQESARTCRHRIAVRMLHGIGNHVYELIKLYDPELTLQRRIDILEQCVLTVAARNGRQAGQLTAKDAADAYSSVMDKSEVESDESSHSIAGSSRVSLQLINEQFCDHLGRILIDRTTGLDNIDYNTHFDSPAVDKETENNQRSVTTRRIPHNPEVGQLSTGMQHTNRPRVSRAVLHRRVNEDLGPPTNHTHTNNVVCVVVEEAFTDSFMSECRQYLNTALFAQGLKGRFVRISTTANTPAPFLISNNLYESVPANQFEERVLSIMNNIMERQTMLIGNNLVLTEGQSPPTPFRVNMLQVVVSHGHRNGYFFHDDTSPLVTNRGESFVGRSQTAECGSTLPSVDDQQTFTIVLTNTPNLVSHKIIWAEAGNIAVPIGELPLSGNCVHIQMHGSQSGLKHRVVTATIDDRVGGELCSCRAVLSGRIAVDITGMETMRSIIDYASEGPINIRGIDENEVVTSAMYRHRGILDKFCSPPKPLCFGNELIAARHGVENAICDHHGGDGGFNNKQTTPYFVSNLTAPTAKKRRRLPLQSDDEMPPINLNSSQYKDSYLQLKQAEYQLYDIHRTAVGISLGQPAWMIMSHATSARHLAITHGQLLSVRYKASKTSVVTTINTLFGTRADLQSTHRVPLPLERYSLSDVAKEANLLHCDQTHPPIRTDDDLSRSCNVAILTTDYKNEPDSIVSVFEYYKRRRQQQKRGLADDQEEYCPPIIVGGSGGAPTTTAVYQPLPQNTSKAHVAYSLPRPQDPNNPLHLTMQRMNARKGILAVYASVTEFELFESEEDQGNRHQLKDIGTFLGYFKITETKQVSTDISILQEEENDRSRSDIALSALHRWKEMPHYTFQLQPLFNNMDWDTIEQRNNSHGWTMGVIDSKAAEDDVVVRLPNSSHRRLLGLGADCLSFGSALNIFLRSGAWVYCLEDQPPHNDEFHDYMLLGEDDDAIIDPRITVDVVSNRSSTILPGGEKDVVVIAAHVSFAGSRRYRGESLKPRTYGACTEQSINLPDDTVVRGHPGDYVSTPLPLHCDYGVVLGSALRGSPMDMPIRAYDLIPLLLRGCALASGLVFSNDGGSCDRRVQPVLSGGWDEHQLFLADFLFRSILLRMTGRVGRFSCYYRDTVLASSSDNCPAAYYSWVPSRDEWSVFESYFLRTISNTHSTSAWVSAQHKCSVPKCLLNEKNVFINFFRKVRENVGGWTTTLVEQGQLHGREMAIATMTLFMEGTLNNVTAGQFSSTSGLAFIAGEIVADISEIYRDPFGDFSVGGVGVQLGTGSSVALAMLPRDLTTGRRRGGQDWLRLVVAYLKSCYPDDVYYRRQLLMTMGLYEKEPGDVRVCLNGRPINIKDAEHMLCKVYILVYKTIGDRAVTAKPMSSKPECHPAALYAKCPWDDAAVSKIMEDCTWAMQAMQEQAEFGLPEVCKLHGE